MLFVFSCSKNEKMDVAGVYEIDKYNFRNLKSETKDFRYLEIKSNGTFNLFYKLDSSSVVSGNWSFGKQIDKEKIVNFSYGKKQKQAILRGNIFYFIYPNDFHKNKYQSVLYVKSNKEN